MSDALSAKKILQSRPFTGLAAGERARVYAYIEIILGDQILETLRVLFRDTMASRLELRKPADNTASVLWENEWRSVSQIRELRETSPYGFNEAAIRRIMEERLLPSALVEKREESHPKRREMQKVFLYRPTQRLTDVLLLFHEILSASGLPEALSPRALDLERQLQGIEAAASGLTQLMKEEPDN